MAIPRATARLQLHQGFGFDDAAAAVPYYAALGISHFYASPILTARHGSTHGYDIVDPTRINPELGGEDGLRRLVARLRAAGMGMILDIVPNHMGVGPENPWWQHVLEWGQGSPYARWFDIDWQPADETLQGKVMAPFLGQPYGDALHAGEIGLRFDERRGKLFVSYYDHRFPVAPADYANVLRAAGSERLAPAIAAFENYRGDAVGITQQNADLGFGMLRELARSREGAADIETALRHFSAATPEGAAALPALPALHALLERQHYRLAWWRCAADGINWRRFFEITDLAGVRVEQDDVFEATHALIFRLYTEGLIDGVRIDHVDGLADPGAYCRKLRRRLQALTSQRPLELPPAPAYLVVEKILAVGEPLRTDWDIDGTSGYDFMDQVSALLHDPAGEAPLSALWQELTGSDEDFQAEVRRARRQLLANNLSGEFEAAARALHAVARTDLRTRDFSLGAIRRVFTELLVHFPVYRTYADANGRDELDQQVIERALEQARHSVDRTEAPLLDVLARWLGGDAPADAASPRVRALHQRALNRFQQLTPPLAAKSVEDTAFYRYGRLLSRNEVGSDPGRFALSAQAFHDACLGRAASFPHALLATATHDHKRGEDLRMRIAVLSELPQEWAQTVRGWMRMNAPLRSEVPSESDASSGIAPQPADELMLYQMLVGAWPIGLSIDDAAGVREFAGRIERWQTKALREAKQVSDWVLPNVDYEEACRRFLYGVLEVKDTEAKDEEAKDEEAKDEEAKDEEAKDDGRFLPQLAAWVGKLTPAGAVNSLSQTVLRMTVPGVPDLYQGTDFWDFSLVDPDNRRPVDYASRERALQDMPPSVANLGDWRSGHLKQQVIRHLLSLRAAEPELFARGDYLPLQLEGPLAGHAIAFLRRWQGRAALVLASRLACALLASDAAPHIAPAVWKETRVVLPGDAGSRWKDVITGRQAETVSNRLQLADALALLPVAVLTVAAEPVVQAP